MRSLNRISLALCIFVQWSSNGLAQSGIITTYAGPAMPVNGAQANTQAIEFPTAVAADGTGGFYVASPHQNRVYRVTADGRISLVAGTSGQGFSGDGGPAISAQLNRPSGVAVDAAGNLFIADTGNFRVRKVTPQGVISTVAGNGHGGVNGDGGPAPAAQLAVLTALAVDGRGNVFIASGDGRIRKVTPEGVISTVAGNGHPGFSGDGSPATSAQLNQPHGVAVDATGNLFIGDYGNQRVRKVTPGGVISTVAGNGSRGLNGDGGPASSAELNDPSGIAVDAAGILFIADYGNRRVRRVVPGGLISTAAGSGGSVLGDGGPATSAQLSTPSGVAVDAAGNLFIADSNGNRVRKVGPGGVISTVAGIGRNGYGGDGGPATSAQLSSPFGVAMDKAGNLFIADSGNMRVRKVTPDGVISTIAGGGTQPFRGDGVPATSVGLPSTNGVAVDVAGNLFIAENTGVRRVSPDGVITKVAGGQSRGFSGDGGPAASAQFVVPFGIAVDAVGDLFITDPGNERVRMVTPDGVIRTVAGMGIQSFNGDGGPATSAQLYHPRTVDAAGNLFIADSDNNRVRKVTPEGVISTVAGNGGRGFSGDGGLATSAQLNGPAGMELDTAGNLFIVDFGNNRVRKVTPTGVISTVAGGGARGYVGDGGPATSAQLNGPSDVALDTAGNLFIAEFYSNRVRKVTRDGLITTVAGDGNRGYSGDGGPATFAKLASPSGVAVDSSGNLFIVDSENHRVRKVASNGVISTVTGTANMGNYGPGPSGIAVDAAGNLFIADSDNNRVRKVTPGGVASTVAGNGVGGFGGDGGAAISAQLSSPGGVSVDATGNLFIADTGNNRIRKVTPAGVISTVAGNGTVVGYGGDGGPATSAQLHGPYGVAVDAAGNLFIADRDNCRIRKVTPGGVISTVAGNGTGGFSGDGGPATSAQLAAPHGVAVDAAGNLFIADYANNRIRMVTPDGIIRTVAGNGTMGFSGDGGPATSAQLFQPGGVAVDAAGNLFIADTFNNRVRKVTLKAPPPRQ